MPPAVFETEIPASEWPQAHALDCTAIEIDFRTPDRPARSKSLYLLSYPGPKA